MNLLKTTFLLTLLTLLLVAMGGAIGGKSGMMIAFLIAGGMNFFAYWNSDKIVLKIDKSFVKNLPEASALALIRAMLGIAISLEITPLAEGIETREQLQQLKSLGCKLGQGYLFSPPVPAAEFEELLKKQDKA